MRSNKTTAAIWIIGAILFSVFAVSAAAQDMLAPGRLDSEHAEEIDKCSACHEPLAGPTEANCLKCHKDIARAKSRRGQAHYLIDLACSECHKLHGAAIGEARLRPGSELHPGALPFMRGEHSQLACGKCHPDGEYERLSKACESCHDQRPHGPTIHSGCAGCHTTVSWERATSKHVNKLTDKHVTAPCGACHRNTDLRQTPRACSACHSAEHRTRVSTACDSCHTQVSWREIKHDHRPEADCQTCHTKPSEHRDGPCASCHNTRTWRGASLAHPRVREHSYRSFPCRSCHPNGFQTATCTGCHDSNDPDDDD